MRKSNAQPIGDIIKEMLQNLNLEEKVTEARIAGVWEEIMGQAIARYTSGITFRNKSLTIKLSSPVLRQELTYDKSKIIGLINEALGQNAVEEIFFN